MGTTTVDDLKEIIPMNLIKSNVVTMGNVNLAIKVYGPDVGYEKQANSSCQQHSGDTQWISGSTTRPDSLNGRIDSKLTKCFCPKYPMYYITGPRNISQKQLCTYKKVLQTNCWQSTNEVVLISLRSIVIMNFSK